MRCYSRLPFVPAPSSPRARLVAAVSNVLSASTTAPAFAADAVASPTLAALPAAPLDAARIAAVFDGDVECVVRTGSTNADLLGRFREHAPARPVVRAALEQLAGRGRHGRAWVTAPGSALLFSLGIPLRSGRAVDSAVSLAVGLAAAEALAVQAPVQVKWPNDLFLDGRKLAGVLCELALDGEGRRTLVAGIGINLTLSDDARRALGQPVAALDEVIAPALLAAQREALIGRIATAVCAAVAEVDQHGFGSLRARFLARFVFLGREVELLEAGARVAAGVAVDIDASGRLMVLTDAGTRSFAAGELSLRPRS